MGDVLCFSLTVENIIPDKRFRGYKILKFGPIELHQKCAHKLLGTSEGCFSLWSKGYGGIPGSS